MKKNILVSNDDGIYGPGLKPLIAKLRKIANVIVVVPSQERSGTSHSITLHKPLRVQKISNNIYIANGTPADCVRFGALTLCKGKVDLVVSGVNSGPNLGQDVVYSGTVAAAREGVMLNIPSMALSVADSTKANFKLAADIAAKLASKLLDKRFPDGIYMNINVPYRSKGIKITTLCKRIYDENIECRTDPRGLKYYWLAGRSVTGIPHPGTDLAAVENSYVSLTPLQINPTATQYFDLFNLWIKNLS